MNIHSDLKRYVETKELSRIVKKIHDNYQPFLLDSQVWDLLKRSFPEDIYRELLLQYEEHMVGHKLVNDIVMNLYFGEKKVKYHLLLKYLNRKEEVSMFELNIGTSRLDFARINGHSYAYEIKTELDSLDKLEKQIADYSKAFEYVQVVCHPDHYNKVKEKVPDYCGIVTYNSNKENLPFSFKQKRSVNYEIDPVIQISSLTTKELEKILKDQRVESIPQNRKCREDLIMSLLSNKQINHHFKERVKERFQKRWVFICDNITKIEPIDIQAFFNSNVDPFWIYYKNSSIV
ncbi:hypothetical protein HNR77_002465 [Paenibacillus sp. JGP012]|uniref:sce7726 family protein n=1 Tax=Paenibacillus sp. JGP012 TaxID=2735914 RepID=UPI00160DC252|nr:sce7726 family protein [Paenibacillus sp. JGP012]MBB6021370.1 hypothetical protein [Paenibacillus sp. JGP012]